ncbi:MAG TPA: type II CAAX endopeptidase family protein [Blastocatellia bacterium]|nr:type II CAAX endopeptidase family protein [Blastocatellia bacterium]
MDAEIPFSEYKTRGILLCLGLCLFTYGILYGIATSFWRALIDEELQTNVLYIFTYLWVLNWVRIKNRKNRIDAGLFFKPGGSLKPIHLLGLVIALFLFSMSMLWITYYPVSYLSPSLVESLILEADPPSSSTLNYSLETAITIVIAPVVEEVFFRGILLNRWATKWGIRKAIIISSIAFAVLHVDFLGAFIFSVAMALLYTKTRTLVAPIAAHILNNAIVIGVTLALDRFQGDSGNVSIEGFRSGIWIGATLLAITLPFLIVYIKRNWPPKDRQAPYAEQLLKNNSEEAKELAASV